jgi:hypothetical protein
VAAQNSNVASQSENLHLPGDRDRLVDLAIKVEPRQHATAGSADSGEMRISDVIRDRKSVRR